MPEWVHLGVGCIYPSLDGHSLIPCFLFRKYIVCGNCLVFISNLTKTLKKILSSPNVHCDCVLQLN